MTEIKEILDILTFNKKEILNGICNIEDFISREKIIKLLDYITNLQKENKAYKEIINIQGCQLEELRKQKTDYTQVNILEMQLNDYKTRNEKVLKSLIKKQNGFGVITSVIDEINILQRKSDEYE